MKIKQDCIPCMTHQLVRLAKRVTKDESVQETIIEDGLKVIAHRAFTSSAPYVTGGIYHLACEKANMNDPFKDEKHHFNQVAKELIESMALRDLIHQSSKPLETAIRLSIAGNIIDFGIGNKLDRDAVKSSLDLSLTSPLFGQTINQVTKAIDQAKNILFITDNAGEIVFDKLLLEQLPLEKITFVVKGGPAVNDATIIDAKEAGINQMVRVIDNGANYQGSILELCSPEFLDEYHKADLIISKGQANFENLSDEKDKAILFLMRAKCQVIANEIESDKGAFVMMLNKNNSLNF